MIDLFSKHSEQYAQFRPTYPDALYQFIFSQVNSFDAAWDCGTGNGQAAHVLARKFKKVFATDISTKQIEHAVKSNNIFYSVAGEETTFLANSINLITAGQVQSRSNVVRTRFNAHVRGSALQSQPLRDGTCVAARSAASPAA